METNSPTYVHLIPNRPPPSLEPRPFKAVVVIEEGAAPEWQAVVCDWLVISGCRYAMVWGVECDTWHHGVDEANLRRFKYGEIPDDEFVMTTDHKNELLADAFWFGGHSAHHPTLDLDRTYIMHIASRERSDELLHLFHKAQETFLVTE